LRKARVGAADIFARAFARDGEKRARKCGRGSASGCSSRRCYDDTRVCRC
jgi:hypothetical protein